MMSETKAMDSRYGQKRYFEKMKMDTLPKHKRIGRVFALLKKKKTDKIVLLNYLYWSEILDIKAICVTVKLYAKDIIDTYIKPRIIKYKDNAGIIHTIKTKSISELNNNIKYISENKFLRIYTVSDYFYMNYDEYLDSSYWR